MKSKKKLIGPIVEVMFFIIVVSVLSFVFSMFGANGYKTEAGTFETLLVIVNNIFSKEGIKQILRTSISNFQTLEPLVTIILSLIAVSIMEASGLLKQLFTPLSKLKIKNITLMVMLVGIVSTIIGDYSYALLLPLSGILYKYIGKNSSLGVLTMFIAITIGYGTGIIYNYQMYQLGDITELSTSGILSEYNYELLSNIYFLIISTIVIAVIGSLVINKFSKQFQRNEEKDNLNLSKKASKITFVAFIIMLAIFLYCIIPGMPHSGLLLDKTEPTYIGKLFGAESLLNKSLMFLIILMLSICGYIYGKVSRNIKNADDFSRALTYSFEDTGYVFALMFFASILYGILDWSNLATVLATNIIDFVGASKLSGLVLIITVFLSIVLISILIPSSITKWTLIAPIYVPLMMRSNISPTFTQSVFQAADSVGKILSPIYIYLIIAVGFMCKYGKDSNISIIGTMKKIMYIILILATTWLVIVILWYLLGLPIGIHTYPTV